MTSTWTYIQFHKEGRNTIKCQAVQKEANKMDGRRKRDHDAKSTPLGDGLRPALALQCSDVKTPGTLKPFAPRPQIGIVGI